MTGEIMQAVLKECQQLLQAQTADIYTGGTVVFKTDWKPEQTADQMPLILLDMIDSPDASQYLGGVTRMDWMFAMNAYSTMPDAYADDIADPYSTSLINIIDVIRQHFTTAQANSTWLTDEMVNITEDYGFKFTLSGLQMADALAFRTGFIKGWRILFDSVAVEEITDFTTESTEVLENVVQIGSTETNELFTPYLQTKNLLLVANTTYIVPANSYVPTLSLQTVMGSPIETEPTVRIGITPGGNEIMADTPCYPFQPVRPEFYADSETTIYFTMTGAGIVNVRIDVIRNYMPKLVVLT